MEAQATEVGVLIKQQTGSRWLMWAVSGAFVLFQFFLQMSSGVMIGQLMHSFPINAFGVALISAGFYVVYTLMQVPAGMLVDRLGVRRLLSGGAILCGLGCWVFAGSQFLWVAILGRMLMGAGSCFAFVGELKVMMDWFPARWFGLLLGFAETLGMLGTMTGEVGLAKILEHASWRLVMINSGFFAVCLGVVCWLVLRDRDEEGAEEEGGAKQAWSEFFQDVNLIIKGWAFWLNGIYCGIIFAMITVFGAFWEIPYLVAAEHISTTKATLISSMLFLGIAVASPMMGWLYPRVADKRRFLAVFAVVNAFLVSLMLYFPPFSFLMNIVVMFFMGVACSSYIFNFSLVTDCAPKRARSTGVGFTNALCVVTAPLLQPLVGWILDFETAHRHTTEGGLYSVAHFHGALAVVPILLLVASLLACGVPTRRVGKDIWAAS